MTADVENPTKYFKDRGLDVRIEEHDLHADFMASTEPDRASLFVEGRSYLCVELLRDATIVAPGVHTARRRIKR